MIYESLGGRKQQKFGSLNDNQQYHHHFVSNASWWGSLSELLVKNNHIAEDKRLSKRVENSGYQYFVYLCIASISCLSTQGHGIFFSWLMNVLWRFHVPAPGVVIASASLFTTPLLHPSRRKRFVFNYLMGWSENTPPSRERLALKRATPSPVNRFEVLAM